VSGFLGKIKSHILISSLLLSVCLVGQFLLFSRSPFSEAYGGDEPQYVQMATHFIKYGNLPKATVLEKDVLEGKVMGTPKPRLFGYPFFIAFCNMYRFQPEHIRIRCALVQFFLIVIVLGILFAFACVFLGNTFWLYLIAMALGLQPWAFEYARSLYPDSVTASFTSLGLIGLFLFLIAKKGMAEWASFFIATLFLCLTFLFRPEMIVLVFLVMVFAAVSKVLKSKSWKYAPCFIAVFLIFFSFNVAYRYYFSGKVQIHSLYKIYQIERKGQMLWLNTWFSSEKIFQRLIEDAPHNHYENVYDNFYHKLPSYAFGDTYEKEQIGRAFEILESKKKHTLETHQIFKVIAEKRIKENFSVNFLLTGFWRAAHLWINLETNSQLLNYLSTISKPIRRPILGGFLLLKLFIYFLAIFSVFALIKRMRRGELRTYDYMTLVMVVFIVLRTILIGPILGFVNHRYVLVAWPAMLWCVITGVIEFNTFCKNKASLSV